MQRRTYAGTMVSSRSAPQLIPWGRVPGMIHPLIIDVSVFMNAQATLPRKEPLRVECVEFLRRVHAAHASGRIILREPPLFVLETFAVINRQAAEHLWMRYPEWKLAPLPTTIEPFTEDDAHELMAAHAACYPTTPPYVKGADLVYLALARKHNAALVTTDDGLLRYGSDGFASVIRPSSWLVPGEAAATPQ